MAQRGEHSPISSKALGSNSSSSEKKKELKMSQDKASELTHPPAVGWSIEVGTAAAGGRAASAEGSAVGGSKGHVRDYRNKEAAGTEG